MAFTMNRLLICDSSGRVVDVGWDYEEGELVFNDIGGKNGKGMVVFILRDEIFPLSFLRGFWRLNGFLGYGMFVAKRNYIVLELLFK